MIKAIIIGASTTGKSTLLKYLKESSDLPLDEMDEMLTRMNNGVYPKDGDHRHNVLEPKMVQDVLSQSNIIFFSNTNVFPVEALAHARKQGFKIILLVLSREKMESRNKHRMQHEGYDDISMYFTYMLEYQEEIKNKGVLDKEIHSDQPIDVIAKDILEILEGN